MERQQLLNLFKVLPVALLAVASAHSMFLQPTQGESRKNSTCCFFICWPVNGQSYSTELQDFHTLRDLEQHSESLLQALDD